MQKLGLCFLFIAAFGCGEGSTKNKASARTFNGQPYIIHADEGMNSDGSAVSGKGSFSFVNPRKDAGNSYALKFTLEEGGSLALVSNAAKDLQKGTTIRFKRSGNTLIINLLGSDGSTTYYNTQAGFDFSGELSFQVDVHNDESPAHIMIWLGSTADFSEETALLNSEELPIELPAGAGNLWGFELDKAKLISAAVSEPKFEE